MLELHLSEPSLVGLYNLSDKKAGEMVKGFIDYMLGRGTPKFSNASMSALFYSMVLLDAIEPSSDKKINEQES